MVLVCGVSLHVVRKGSEFVYITFSLFLLVSSSFGMGIGSYRGWLARYRIRQADGAFYNRLIERSLSPLLPQIIVIGDKIDKISY